MIQRPDRLAAERLVRDDRWQEIAERVLPRQADSNTRNTAGDKRTDNIFDSTACAGLSSGGFFPIFVARNFAG
ncbi:hypothetical protein GH722_01055 [Alphaproteobacteria bacterium HT1-32]|nr:hypothetical protein [Alphaproteobacteria bacterium HT1-32]